MAQGSGILGCIYEIWYNQGMLNIFSSKKKNIQQRFSLVILYAHLIMYTN